MKSERSPDDDQRGDADLLEVVARGASEPSRARAAQGTFYARHVRYLYGIVMRHKKNLLPLAGIGAEDLVQETFHRAFERAHTSDRGKDLDVERQRLRTRAWLGRIATNLLTDQDVHLGSLAVYFDDAHYVELARSDDALALAKKRSLIDFADVTPELVDTTQSGPSHFALTVGPLDKATAERLRWELLERSQSAAIVVGTDYAGSPKPLP